MRVTIVRGFGAGVDWLGGALLCGRGVSKYVSGGCVGWKYIFTCMLTCTVGGSILYEGMVQNVE
jgi:hypothetical protein